MDACAACVLWRRVAMPPLAGGHRNAYAGVCCGCYRVSADNYVRVATKQCLWHLDDDTYPYLGELDDDSASSGSYYLLL